MKIKPYELFIFLMLPLCLFDFFFVFNIPLLKQFLAFFLLLLCPGIFILFLLKSKDLTNLEFLLFSYGLSLSFIIFWGIFQNTVFLLLNIDHPLSAFPIVIVYNVLYFAAATFMWYSLSYSGERTIEISKTFLQGSVSPINKLKSLNADEKILLIPPLFFPALSISGTYLLDSLNNNILLLFLFLLIALHLLLTTKYSKNLSGNYYPICIFLISISLVLILPLRSNSILGADIHGEFQFFKLTAEQGFWQISNPPQLIDSCLSITIIPIILNAFLGLQQMQLYKLVFSVLFSITPLIIYVISKKYLGEFYGYMAALFFISQSLFITIEYQPRTSIAILFFTFFILTLTRSSFNISMKKLFLIIFFTSCIFSHYATTYIALFLVVGSFIALEFLSYRIQLEKDLDWVLISIFLGTTFFWYNQITFRNFESGISFVLKTISEMNQFLILESRGESSAGLMGVGLYSKGIPHQIEFFLTWIIILCIGIGVLALSYNIFLKVSKKKSSFSLDSFDIQYSIISIFATCILGIIVLIPFLIPGYGMGRVWLLLCCLLSGIFILGLMVLAWLLDFLKNKYLTQLNTTEDDGDIQKDIVTKVSSEKIPMIIPFKYIVAVIIIAYFLSTTGVTYEVFGYNKSILLNSDGFEYNLYYVTDRDLHAAIWAYEQNIQSEIFGIYVIDPYSIGILKDQGVTNIIETNPKKIDFSQLLSGTKGNYLFFRTYNTGGKYLDAMNIEHPLNIPIVKSFTNFIYTNGGADIFVKK